MPRQVSLLQLVAVTYFVVAGGPYGLEEIIGTSGYGGAILILLATPLLWSLPTALMVSELASALPQDGGYYVWVRRAMGRFWGFQEAWLSLTGSIFDMALYPTLFVSYLGHFVPALTDGGKGVWIGVALIAASALWNLLGARTSSGSSVVLGALLLLPFAVLMGYALLDRTAPHLPAQSLKPDFLGGILVAMWNYMGWDNVSTIAAEVERPQRTYPRAMTASVALVALTYTLPIAAVAWSGLDPSRWTTGGWVDAGRQLAGEGLAAALAAGGMIGAVGTLNGLTLTLSRLPAAMGEDGLLPRVFARRSARTGAPWVAILACAAAWAACLNLGFVKLVVLDVMLTGLSILLEFAALVALRLREPDLPRPYRVPGGLGGAIAIALFPAALMALAVVRNHQEQMGRFNALQVAGVVIGVGIICSFVASKVKEEVS